MIGPCSAVSEMRTSEPDAIGNVRHYSLVLKGV